jgi:hypothetical protein
LEPQVVEEEEEEEAEEAETFNPNIDGDLAAHLNRYVRANAAKLGFDPEGSRPDVEGFHPSFRVNSHGQLLMELVAQFVQRVQPEEDFGGMKVFAGATVVASADGTIRYVIAKPFAESLGEPFINEVRERKKRQHSLVEACDREDAFLPWAGPDYEKTRIARVNLARLHGRLLR